MREQVLRVDGMSCEGCVRSVTEVLRALPGVVQVEVSLADHNVTVCFDESRVELAHLHAAIAEAGFDSTG